MTSEIVRWPDTDDYDVRVSVADVVLSGPFSRFPGYRRWSILIGPAPIELATKSIARRVDVPGELATRIARRVDVPGELATSIARRVDVPGDLATSIARRVDVPAELATSIARRVDVREELATSIARRVDVPAELATIGVYRLVAVGDLVELDGNLAIDATLPSGPTTLFNVLERGGHDVRVGVGVPPEPVRFAFALDEGGELPHGHARVYEPAAIFGARAIWIA